MRNSAKFPPSSMLAKRNARLGSSFASTFCLLLLDDDDDDEEEEEEEEEREREASYGLPSLLERDLLIESRRR